MKGIFIFVLGLLAGVAAGASLIYFNPLMAVSAPLPGDEQWLSYDSPVTNNLLLTHSGALSMQKNPADVPELWEGTIAGTALLLVDLRNSDGSLFGLGTRIGNFSPDTDLLWNGVGLDSYWTVSVPGRGIFFVVESEHLWPVLKEVILPTRFFYQNWRGRKGYALNAGPLDSGHGLVLGGTGQFRGRRGRALERYELRRYSTSAGAVDMSAELGIFLPASASKSDSETGEAS